MPEVRPDEHAKQVMANLYSGFKTIWIFLMLQSLVVALRETCQGMKGDIEECQRGDVILLTRLVIFYSVFTRIFFGDLRILDIQYSEPVARYGAMEAVKTFSHRRVFADAAMLLLNAGLVFVIAVKITEPDRFYFFICVFFILNVIWLLLLSARTAPFQELPVPDASRPVVCRRFRSVVRRFVLSCRPASLKLPRLDSTTKDLLATQWIWILNNGTCIAFAATVYVARRYDLIDKTEKHLAFFVIWFANAVFDYVMTWKFYVPDILRHCEPPPPEVPSPGKDNICPYDASV